MLIDTPNNICPICRGDIKKYTSDRYVYCGSILGYISKIAHHGEDCIRALQDRISDMETNKH